MNSSFPITRKTYTKAILMAKSVELTNAKLLLAESGIELPAAARGLIDSRIDEIELKIQQLAEV